MRPEKKLQYVLIYLEMYIYLKIQRMNKLRLESIIL